MKKIKYILFFVILAVGLVFIGESFQDCLNCFETEYVYVTFYKPHNISNNEMIKDIKKSAKDNNIKVFVVDRDIKSTFETDVDIYQSDKEVSNDLYKRFSLKQKDYNSLISGKTNVKIHEFNDNLDLNDIKYYFVLGKKDNIKNFKLDLVNKYGGSFPKKNDSSLQSDKTVTIAWTLIIILTILLTIYDIVLQKKEIYIKTTYGERIIKFIFTNILKDTLVFAASFVLIEFILKDITCISYKLNQSLLMFLILVVINSLMYLLLYFNNNKKAFSKSNSSSGLLTVNYSFKLITSILTLLIISCNIAVIYEGYSFYSQKDFFKAHSDYNFIHPYYYCIDGKEPEDYDHKTNCSQYSFYKSLLDSDKASVQFVFETCEYNTIYMNKNRIGYLKSNLKEFENKKFDDNTIYFLIPNKFKNKNKDKLINELYDTTSFMLDMPDNFKYNYEVLFYKENIRMPCVGNDIYTYDSDILKKPIIIFDNMNARNANYEVGEGWSLGYDTMYKATKEDFYNFVKSSNFGTKDLSVQVTNVYDQYLHNLTKVKRLTYINFILSVIFIIIDIIIIYTILKLEYTVNSVELSIKKVLGYGKFEKNKKIFIVSLSTSVLSIIASLIINLSLGVSQGIYIVVGGIIMILLEIPIISHFIRKMEKVNVQKILKGGKL